MPQTRVFVPQDAVEGWLGEGRANLGQDVLGQETLTLDGYTFLMSGAVRFMSEVSGADDVARVVGRVKSREQLLALAAEHSGQSVVLGDNAYEVEEGYLLALQYELGGAALPVLTQLFAGS